MVPTIINMRRRRMRRSSPRSVVQSYKKVLNFAPTSRAAAAVTDFRISQGVDSVAAGQTSVSDPQVPTGSVITAVEIQYSQQNLVNIAGFTHLSIQRVHNGQTNVAPNAVGGDPQRNQVHFQMLKCVGQNQNVNSVIKFKVPKKFQRVREGDIWTFATTCDVIWTDAVQIIYKFYR